MPFINHLLTELNLLWQSISVSHRVLLYATWEIGSILFLLGQRRPPLATLSWILASLGLPVLSLGFYFVFGPRKLKRRNIRRELARHLAAHHGPRRHQQLPETLASRHWLLAQARVATECGSASPRQVQGLEILIDGDAAYAAIETAMQQAVRQIHVEYYIFKPDEIGTRWRDLLTDKARAGVKVRILVDAVGSGRCHHDFWQPLRQAGGEVRVFNPPRLVPFRPSMVNFRTHRKIVVIDAFYGFTGGINVDRIESASCTGVTAWRDTHLALRGNAALDLQRLFLEDWLYAGTRSGNLARLDKALTTPQDIQAWFPFHHEEAGDGLQPWVQIIDSGPDRGESAIYRFFFAAISSARHRVWITTPYFIPDEAIMTALTTAAVRGVDIRLLVPMESDQLLTGLAASTFVEEVLTRRVKVYAYVPRFIHAKTLVVDDELSAIGTANMDNRSFRLNFEVMAAIYDKKTTSVMARQFLKDLESATQLHADFQPGSFSQRMVASLARLAAPLL
ncbi:MAG: cardiolipin synthase [Lautropia sp.]|nr:cardiolipin synthase [Lautropia sp.]